MQNIDLSKYSEEERKAIMKILDEVSATGASSTMNDILREDWKETPVDIETFLHDPYYLGKALIDGEGRFTVYPYWENLLKKIYPDPLKPAICNTLALTGCLTGDTEVILADGNIMTMKELADIGDLDLYVASYDNTAKRFAIGHLVQAFSTGVKKVYAITLDNEEIVKATSNHRFMDPFGDWTSIDSGLKPGDNLLSFYGSYEVVSIEYLGEEEVYDLTVEKYHNFVLKAGIIAHNSIGLGKSTIAVLVGLYEMYRMMCLRDPYVYYGIMNIDVISFAVINITLDAAEGVAWSKLQNMVQSSEWFMSHGDISKADPPVWKPKGQAKIELICGSQPRHFIGRALFFAFFDEINFIPTESLEKQKQKATELISSATARMQSRFMKNDVNPTVLVLASSKRTEQSFLETWIDNKKQQESKTTIVIDEPQWAVRPDKMSDRTFKVAVGNKFLPSEALPVDASEDVISSYRDQGYRLIDVPIGYYETFMDDIDIALTDVAGISVAASSSYISGARLTETKSEKIFNPFVKDIIEVGNSPDDTAEYSDYFDLSKVDPQMKRMPLYIHLDMSLTGDKTGIAGVWQRGKLPTQPGKDSTKEMYYQLAFVVSVKAPKGYQVSFQKTRNFIYWLKQKGFNVKTVSSDTFARSGIEQELQAKGYAYSIISVDRVEAQSKVCRPYEYFKNTIYEKRILIPRTGVNLLTEEIVGLVRNNSSGKIDHTVASINSKDSSDAVCGALWSASQHIDEFVYDFGESLDTLIDFNSLIGVDDIGAFEQALIAQKQPDIQSDSQFMDFGFGLPEEIPYDVSDGIMFW